MMTNFQRRGRRVPPHNNVPVPGCDCLECEAARRDDRNDAAGCLGPWMLLFVGFIAALTAIGICLIIISVEMRDAGSAIRDARSETSSRILYPATRNSEAER